MSQFDFVRDPQALQSATAEVPDHQESATAEFPDPQPLQSAIPDPQALQSATAEVPDPQALQSAAAGPTPSPIAYMGGDRPCSTHLIDGDGIFDVDGLQNFIKEIKFGERRLSYAVVAIMGPQSSGKSTLLNHLFGTNFIEMDASEGRSKTTKGIWIAQCVDIEPCTLVMDIEGSDGVERGEDDTAFEKRSALFALAISDVLLINIWCHDIGREHAANRPLLKTVFQVMLTLFSTHRKTTLMFVIRDKTRTSLEKLELKLREDIKKIWDDVPKPPAQKNTPLSKFFKVEVVALSSYELQEEEFKKEVANLRQRFNYSTERGGLAGDTRGVVPASAFSISAQNIWKVIKDDKDLDLPAHKVMVATVRCEEIANEKFSSFIANKEWRRLKETALRSQPVDGFGEKLTSILDDLLSEYDAETIYFEEDVRSLKQKQLKEKLLQLIQPAYQAMLGHIRSGTFDKFKAALDNALKGGKKGFKQAASDCAERFMAQFDGACADADVEQANWEYSSEVRDKLRHDMNEHIAAVEQAKNAQEDKNGMGWKKGVGVCAAATFQAVTMIAGISTPINLACKVVGIPTPMQAVCHAAGIPTPMEAVCHAAGIPTFIEDILDIL